MKIAILGSGAVGGYFGGRLAQAGHDVAFIARGDHLRAILKDGLQVESLKGDFAIHPARASERPEEIGAVDVVLCCVKSWQVAAAAEMMRPMLGEGTVVIPLQNGVEAHTTLSTALGDERVLPGLCRIISMVKAPGKIAHTGADPFISFGEPAGRSSSGRAEAIARGFAGAQGLTVAVSANILADLWRKFMLIAPWSGVGALTRAPIGVIRSIPETREILEASIREVFAVAVAHEVPLEAAAVDRILRFIDKLPYDGTASMQRDVMEGRPSELHEQTGAIVRFGQSGPVPTPISRFIYYSLLPLERKARGEIAF